MRRTVRVRMAAALLAAGLCAFGTHGMLAQGPAPVPLPPKSIHSTDDPLLKPFVFRSGGRHCRRRKQPVHHLHRVRDGGRVEEHEQRDHLDADLRRAAGDVDWRHRDRAVGPQRRLRGHGRAQQSSEFVVRRRRVQVGRRRQDVRVRRVERDADDRAHRRPSEGSERRVRGGAGPPVRTEQGARPLQDDGRRQELDEHEVHRRRHRVHRRCHGCGESEHPLRRVVSTAPGAMGIQRRRSWQRAVENDGRRQDVDEAHRQRTPRQPSPRPHRAGRRAIETRHDLRVDRSGTERRHRRGRQ